MTPQERDTILAIIDRAEPDIKLANSGYERQLINGLLEVASYARAITQAHVRETAVWITRDDQVIRIVDLDNDHLLAIERAIAAGTAPATEQDRINITTERERRGLTPLKARKPIVAKISKLLTDIHATYRTADKSARRHFLNGLGNFLREAAAFMNEEDRLTTWHAAENIASVNPGDAQPTVTKTTPDIAFDTETHEEGQASDIVVGIDPGSPVAVTIDNKTGKVTSFSPVNAEAIADSVVSVNTAPGTNTAVGFNCNHCRDTGYIETGNNDLPCTHCHRGRDAVFNTMDGKQTGAETHTGSWPASWGNK